MGLIILNPIGLLTAYYIAAGQQNADTWTQYSGFSSVPTRTTTIQDDQWCMNMEVKQAARRQTFVTRRGTTQRTAPSLRITRNTGIEKAMTKQRRSNSNQLNKTKLDYFGCRMDKYNIVTLRVKAAIVEPETSITRKRLGKHVPAEMNAHTTVYRRSYATRL
jgi:hypothetical protein